MIHDLPPLWDLEPVEWTIWSTVRSTLALHLPAEELACQECGAVDEPMISWGKRGPFRDIYAARCRHCWHDVVTDTRTGERWDLDPSDYGPAGSTNPTTDTLF